MLRLFGRRLALGVAAMGVVSILVFAVTNLLPGDAAMSILGQEATEESRDALRLRLGLDEPPVGRYFAWLGDVLQGDFGNSFATDVPVSHTVGLRGWNTLRLALVTALIAVPLSLALGLLCAAFPGSLGDRALNVGSLFIVSLPEFVVGLLLVLVFAVQFRWLPAVTTSLDGSSFLGMLRGLALPALTLVAAVQAHMIRMTRAAVLDVMRRPYIEMARLKGASLPRLILRHGLPNALAPIVNVVALNLGYLVAGVVVVEVVFSYPGLGQLMVESVATRDMPMIQATALIFCGTYVLLTLLADAAALAADPRLKHR